MNFQMGKLNWQEKQFKRWKILCPRENLDKGATICGLNHIMKLI